MPVGDDVVTPDGSPVPIYLALPAEPSFTPVLERLPAGASVLDLGCGVGRLANVLVGRGHDITAVDESDAMLAHVHGRARTVRSSIEELELGRTFDAVVLASHLINVPDVGQRRAFLTTIRHHLATSADALAAELATVGLEPVATPTATWTVAAVAGGVPG